MQITIQPCSDTVYLEDLIRRHRTAVGYGPEEPVPPLAQMPPWWALEGLADGRRSGAWLFFQRDSDTEVHTLLDLPLRGRAAIQATRAAAAWVWENTQLPRLVSFAFLDRPKVGWFARQCGMVPRSGVCVFKGRSLERLQLDRPGGTSCQ